MHDTTRNCCGFKKAKWNSVRNVYIYWYNYTCNFNCAMIIYFTMYVLNKIYIIFFILHLIGIDLYVNQ